MMGIVYRTRQFWLAMTARPSPDDLAQAAGLLSPALFQLFEQMQPSEQAHSLEIFRRLQWEGETDRDLLAAALLHDVGKSHCPLRLWERVWIVLARAAAPQRARRWGQAAPRGWRRALVVAEQHPAWGAEMARQAGASAVTVELIRRHQETLVPAAASRPDSSLLIRLQSLDNER
jgi:putative nucleotidyltransferase with HDIG domain